MALTYWSLASGPLLQSWSDPSLITTDDNWDGVPSILGFRGDDLTAATGIDPRTVTGTSAVLDVNANKTDPVTFTTGGVTEFALSDPTIALAGSGTADAPYLVLYLDATGRKNVHVQFNARDIEGGTDDAAQQLAVQYRIGPSGTWTTVTAGTNPYIADATALAPTAPVTAVDVTLPSAADNQAQVEVRIITTNAPGNDEWIGIDDISVSSEAGDATPAPQTVAFAAGSLSVTKTEGNAGTRTYTFTVERTGGTVGQIDFSGAVAAGSTDAADYVGGTAPTSFSGSIAAGAASAQVSVEIAGDTSIETDESFTLTLQSALNSDGAVTTSLGTAVTATGTIQNDDAPAGNVVGGIKILDQGASLQGSTTAPVATDAIELIRLGAYIPASGNAEVVSFDPVSDRLYVLNTEGGRIDIVGLGATGTLTEAGHIDLSTLPGFGGANSVAIKNGVVAVAVANMTPGANGFIAFYDLNGNLLKTVEVGVGPDQVVFTADGTKLLVAGEAEAQSALLNAPGTVSIIDLSTGAANAAVANTIGFGSLDGFEAVLRAAGLAIAPGQSASADIEPEYISISPDGTRAYVTLQEVNAVAVIDLTDPAATAPIAILPLGTIDRSLAGNAFDASDKDGISLENFDVLSLLQPDAIASFTVGGATYFVTANEGDARVGIDDESAVKDADYVLDPTAYPDAAALKATTALGNLRVLNTIGDTDGDGDFDQIYTYGGRGISIFRQNPDGTIEKVRETGGEFEAYFAASHPELFNTENGESVDTRSDNKGPEPEGVTIGTIDGRIYAFVGLERVGGVMIYDVTDPANASFVGYKPPTAEDYAPEVVTYVSAADSPTGTALVITANEDGSTTVYAAVANPDNLRKIGEVQGSGAVSELDGQAVTVRGVITAIDTNGSRGFYIQDAEGDGNAATSDGIFVYTGSNVAGLAVGQFVEVAGTVDEFTVSGAAVGTPSTTEIVTSASGIKIIGSGFSVAPTIIGGGGLQPPTEDMAAGVAFWEALEGMKVTVTNPVVVGPTNSFGEIFVVADTDTDPANGSGAALTPRGTLLIEGGEPSFGNTNTIGGDFNPERIQIDDDNGVLAGFVSPAASVGDRLGSVTGIVNYDFGNYQVVATEAYAVAQAGSLAKESTSLAGSATQLTVASYNAENLDPTDPDNRFTTIANQILTNLGAPDIVALQEIQDNDGPGSADTSSVTSASVTLQKLVDALNAAAPAGVTYAYIDNPFIGDDTNGGEGGGNIRTAYVYRTDRVDYVEGSLATIAANGSAITAGTYTDQQTNPDNPFYDSRPPLVATFTFNGQDVTIINNHFTSKGGSGALWGDQPPFNAGEVQRAAQAQAVNSFVDGLLGADANAKVIVAGDINEFDHEEPLQVLTGTATLTNYDVPESAEPDPIDATGTFTQGGSAVLFDLNAELPANERYDYVYEGNAESLDHVLVSSALAGAAEFDVVHINSEFADQTSDHDPLVARFDMAPTSSTYTLQLLHYSDAEAGLLAVDTAPNLAALVDAFDDDYANTLILMSGDNWIPGPFLSAGTDLSVTSALNSATGSTIAPGTNIPIAAVDIGIHNAIGVEASALGNHDFDLGSRVLRDALAPNLGAAGWVGAQFPSISANLVVGPNSPYYSDPTATDADLNSLYVDTLDFSAQAPGTSPLTTAVPEASTLKGKIVPSAIITEGGEKIGLVGATTQLLESISSPTGVEIAGFPGGPGANGEADNMDLLAAQLQPVIDELTAEGVNKIVLMTHLQTIDNEIALASKLKGVDIIMAGGSNTRLGDADDEAVAFPGHAADFDGTYPLTVTNAEGKTTLVVNTDGEYTYLGRLVVDFDANGDIVLDSLTANQSINGAYASTAENVAEAWGTTVDNLETTAFADGTKGDKVRDLTTAVDNVITQKDGNVYGYTDVYLEGERSIVRNEETNLGDLTADANALALKVALADAADTTYVVSLKNGGGIRAQIGSVSDPDPVDGSIDKLPPAGSDVKPEGGVSQLDVENSLRFNNKLIAFDTTPEGLKAILEHGVAAYGNQGRFPQIGGVSFSFDDDLPAGSRVQDVALIDEQGKVLVQLYDDGVLLSDVPSKISVVTLNFMADGGDGYPMKANGENFRYLLDDGTLGPVLDPTSDLDANPPANALGEQTALENYLEAFHGTPETAYDVADTPAILDERIQNLDVRADTVLEAEALRFNGRGNSADAFIGGALADTARGNNGDDELFGHGGDDLLYGGRGADKVYGGVGDDTLSGEAGDDALYGGDGNDTIFGDAGNDLLAGGIGKDLLVGGPGNDTYVFSYGDGQDTILGFQGGRRGGDVVQLDAAVYGGFDTLVSSNALRNTLFGAQISYDDGSTLTLVGVNANTLVADDFRFA